MAKYSCIYLSFCSLLIFEIFFNILLFVKKRYVLRNESIVNLLFITSYFLQSDSAAPLNCFLVEIKGAQA
jgi:hypothetical protein